MAVRAYFPHITDPNVMHEAHTVCRREAGPNGWSTSCPFWTKPDWGLFERLGRRPRRDSEPTEILLVAFK